ncbi:MAG: hypothetical protein ABII20_03870 [Candidatus Omnitrophota bacterium]|nr:hypothetical protein [Candidatus Omnitrophota bacterium]MBU2527839.1 hypothetical protein [bacterium]MBU3930754.1 hypothetical protein [bacterium]MBU4123312.1 hypothetical protein [bacterium]
MKIIKHFSGTAVFLILLSYNVCAHKVNIFAYAENGRVYTESYFNDGKAVVNSEIKVYGHKTGELLLSGTSDNLGEFVFDLPQKSAIRIVLNASMGHRNEYILSEEEAAGDTDKPVKNGARAEKPAVRDILAGIGCIFGISGIAMFVKCRKIIKKNAS